MTAKKSLLSGQRQVVFAICGRVAVADRQKDKTDQQTNKQKSGSIGHTQNKVQTLTDAFCLISSLLTKQSN